MNPPEQLRDWLSFYRGDDRPRSGGMLFPAAWEQAVSRVCKDLPDWWRETFEEQRDAWRRAFELKPALPREAVLAEVGDMWRSIFEDQRDAWRSYGHKRGVPSIVKGSLAAPAPRGAQG